LLQFCVFFIAHAEEVRAGRAVLGAVLCAWHLALRYQARRDQRRVRDFSEMVISWPIFFAR
jgi:hypothetical protein